MPDFDHPGTAQLVADWVCGTPDDTRQQRRTRLLAYQRVSHNPRQLGMFLTRVAFDRAMAGAAPGTTPEAWKRLVQGGDPGWRHRVMLAHEVLDLLRDVDVTTDRIAAERAREDAARLLRDMAADSDDPELRDVDWDSDWGPA
jgi:hypothetical protein